MQRLGYTILHACRLFHVLHFKLWRPDTFRGSWITFSRTVCVSVCVWKKEDDDPYPWSCLQKNLSHTWHFLCKLKQTHTLTYTVNLRWSIQTCRYEGTLNVVSSWGMSQQNKTQNKQNKKKDFILHCVWNETCNYRFHIQRGTRETHAPARPRSVYSVYCIRMWTHNYFLQNFEWLCSVSVECVFVCPSVCVCLSQNKHFITK